MKRSDCVPSTFEITPEQMTRVRAIDHRGCSEQVRVGRSKLGWYRRAARLPDRVAHFFFCIIRRISSHGSGRSARGVKRMKSAVGVPSVPRSS